MSTTSDHSTQLPPGAIRLDTAAVELIPTLTTWQLARLAECAEPDVPDQIGWKHLDPSDERQPSDGATFLRHVADATREALEYALRDNASTTGGNDGVEYIYSTDLPGIVHRMRDNGIVSEIADGAPDVYTARRWREFVDLAAWQEDTSELISNEADLTQTAGVALYMIAERLAEALLADAVERAEALADETVTEARVRDLEPGDRYRDVGWIDDEWLTVAELTGDDDITVVDTDGDQASYDGDAVVEVQRADTTERA